MTGFIRPIAALTWLLSLMIGAVAIAQGAAAAASTERFAGEARVGSQPPIPIHLELQRSGDAVTGTVSIPGGRFELLEAQGDRTIVGRYSGPGGTGALTLRVDGDELTGEFDLGGLAGAITARRTSQDAAGFFRPPEQKLDLTTSQWLEDLDQLVRILTREHAAPFHRVSSQRFEHEVERVRAAIPELDGVGVALEFRKLGVMIGDGHTSVDLPDEAPRLPVELYLFADGLRVVGASPTHRDLLGAKLEAVNGVPATSIVEALRAYVAQGETQGFHRDQLPDLIADPAVLRGLGIGEGPSFAFTFEAGAGRRQVDLAAAEESRLVSLGGGEPLWRRNETQGFSTERLADGSVYVNWRSYDGLADAGAALLRSLDAQHPRRLVVDLRDNDGGDYTVGRRFIEEIGKRPWLNRRGVLYVMIGRRTFSAAMTNAVDFKRTTEAVLVGEPAGAAPNNWQEVRRFNLSNSGLRVGVSTRYYAFLPGEAELVPDHRIAPEPGDWGSERDAGVRFVLTQPVP